jgi:hypothetical protein
MKSAMHKTKLAGPKDSRLKAGTESAKFAADSILARWACPICSELKEFQIYLSKNLRAYECSSFCNLHAWIIANSSPAESAATLFLASVRNPDWRPSLPNPSECTFCKRMQIEKETRLREISEELDQPQFQEWLRQHGMLCLGHSRELAQKLPASLQQDIQETMSQKVKELERELYEFLQQAKRGDHRGGGILGRAAEYLVGQRGIES